MLPEEFFDEGDLKVEEPAIFVLIYRFPFLFFWLRLLLFLYKLILLIVLLRLLFCLNLGPNLGLLRPLGLLLELEVIWWGQLDLLKISSLLFLLALLCQICFLCFFRGRLFLLRAFLLTFDGYRSDFLDLDLVCLLGLGLLVDLHVELAPRRVLQVRLRRLLVLQVVDLNILNFLKTLKVLGLSQLLLLLLLAGARRPRLGLLSPGISCFLRLCRLSCGPFRVYLHRLFFHLIVHSNKAQIN